MLAALDNVRGTQGTGELSDDQAKQEILDGLKERDEADKRLQDARPRGRPKKNLDSTKTDVQVYPTGNSTDRALRRLRKNAPDIHARVLAGEISPHAGMVEAGFRKRAKSRAQTPL